LVGGANTGQLYTSLPKIAGECIFRRVLSMLLAGWSLLAGLSARRGLSAVVCVGGFVGAGWPGLSAGLSARAGLGLSAGLSARAGLWKGGANTGQLYTRLPKIAGETIFRRVLSMLLAGCSLLAGLPAHRGLSAVVCVGGFVGAG
jgi:hypothetical protein